jgi:hypothetical protein
MPPRDFAPLPCSVSTSRAKNALVPQSLYNRHHAMSSSTRAGSPRRRSSASRGRSRSASASASRGRSRSASSSASHSRSRSGSRSRPPALARYRRLAWRVVRRAGAAVGHHAVGELRGLHGFAHAVVPGYAHVAHRARRAYSKAAKVAHYLTAESPRPARRSPRSRSSQRSTH